MKYYLAGPMQGIPQSNFPLFFEAAKILRTWGYDIISPAEIDDAEDKGAALKSPDGLLKSHDKTWGDFLSRDVKLLADGGIEGIVFLPGWERSRGAKLEAFVGLLSGFKFRLFGFDGAKLPYVDEVAPYYIHEKLSAYMWNHLVNHKGELSAEKLVVGKEA